LLVFILRLRRIKSREVFAQPTLLRGSTPTPFLGFSGEGCVTLMAFSRNHIERIFARISGNDLMRGDKRPLAGRNMKKDQDPGETLPLTAKEKISVRRLKGGAARGAPLHRHQA